MAVMQTPHGRVIGLILPVEDQPKVVTVEEKPMKEAVEKEPEPAAKAAASVKKAGRPAKK